MERQPGIGQPRFAALEPPLTDGKRMAALEKDFLDWTYRSGGLRLRANPDLKIYAPPEVTTAEFREQTSQAARLACEAEISRLDATYAKKLDALREKLAREQRELDKDEEELSQRKMEELGTHAENIFGLFSKSRRRVTSSLSKHRMTQQAKVDVTESKEVIADLQKQIAALEAAQAGEAQDITDRWAGVASKTSEVTLNPLKKDVFIELFGVAWLPYYLLQSGEVTIELPGFSQ
jgi:hypothetical protein